MFIALTRHRFGGFLLVCACLLLSCWQDPGAALHDRVLRLDSAGILVIENVDSIRTSATPLVLDSHPVLEIGCVACADEATTFGHVIDVLRFGDGRIAVLDILAGEVRVFSENGAFQYRIGSRGPGPGEFALPDRMALVRNDSIMVHDQGSFRQHVFSDRGAYGRSVADARITSWRSLWDMPRAWFPDGRYLLAENIDHRKLPQRRGVATAEWRVMAPDGSDLGVIAVLPAAHGEAQPSVGGYQVNGTTIFSPKQSYGADSTGFWHAFPQTYEIRHITVDGDVDRIVRRSWEPEAVPGSLVSRARDRMETGYRERAASQPESRERLEAERAAIKFADTLPAFRRIHVTRQGGLWVERYPRASEIDLDDQDRYGPKGPSEWSVFDSQGSWIGNVAIPDGFTIHEIGPDHVLGVWRDDFDVSFVRLYRLRS